MAERCMYVAQPQSKGLLLGPPTIDVVLLPTVVVANVVPTNCHVSIEADWG
jgi:hypothetical protein